jgi:hypothetical protein
VRFGVCVGYHLQNHEAELTLWLAHACLISAAALLIAAMLFWWMGWVVHKRPW